MKTLTDKALEEGVCEIFGGEVNVITNNPEAITVEVSQMYEYVDCGLKELLALSEVVGSLNININSRYLSGCETCDYGSSYEQTFYIVPDDES